MRDRHHVVAVAAIAAAVFVHEERVADACGCLSPPAVTTGEYAVNQRAEQIIFEVEPNWVTAHVLIEYAGAPDKFAWLIPVPEQPTELGVSPVSAFGLLDSLTAPQVSVDVQDICPISDYVCQFHDALHCGGFGGDDQGEPGSFADAGAAPGDGEPPVTVLNQQVVGDYDTVTFSATNASAATQWLRDNGFVVNRTTSIYMDPYVQQNMVFVAIKLVPGAGIKAIKPLKIKYRAPFPMIPLVLTAVAAEPHLTVTAYLYGDQPFKPMGHPVVTIDKTRIAQDPAGRGNYPMVLARTIDEAGGDGFAAEYRGGAVVPTFGQGTSCCGSSDDFCHLGGDGQCQCPGDAFDAADCASQGDLVDGVALLNDLAMRHPVLTRLTTRISPEEMSFDPTFDADYSAAQIGRMILQGEQASLSKCIGDVVDRDKLAEIDDLQACAPVYCGTGQCVTTPGGLPGCACDAGSVARQFVDLDGTASITCIPTTPPVDLRAGGDNLPDACIGVDCGSGQCIDRNGIAVCDCDGGAAAIAGGGSVPRCMPIERFSRTPGADNYSEPLRALDVCAPPPPTCGDDGWLVKMPSARPGVDCGRSTPNPFALIEPPPPHCDSLFGGCGGCQSDGAPPVSGFAGAGLVAFLIARRRRR